MGSGRRRDSAETRQDRMPPKEKRGRPKKGDEKKQRKKKDPNAPKRPMSAYFLFMNATRPTVRKENPDASIGEVAKILGKMWGEIEPADKAKYDKDAAAAKKKWEAERRLMPRRENLLRRLPRVGTRKTRRRRRPRTANSKVESCQKKPKGAVANSPKLRSQNACLKPFYRGRILIQAL